MNSILSKLVTISKNIGFMEFDAKNTHFKYGYVSAAAMLKRLNQELAEHGVLCYAQNEDCYYDKEGGCWLSTVRLCFQCAETGESITSVGVGGGQDKGDKGPMKASTAAVKYAIAHAFTLGWGAEDPEDSRADASVLPDPKTVAAAIDKAKTVATLEKQRAEIRLLRKDASYRSLVDKFTAKEKELKNG